MINTEANVWSVIDAVRGASSIASLSGVINEFVRKAGFEHFGFAIKRPYRIGGDEVGYFHLENFPKAWAQQRYEDPHPDSAMENDPVLRHVRSGQPPTAWSGSGIVTTTRPDIARSAKRLLQRAAEHGLRAGLTVPLMGTKTVWGFMVATTGTSADVRDVLPALPNFHLFAHYVHCITTQLLGESMATPTLSSREIEVLRWAAIGKTSWEIGQITQISERTVNFHVNSAARKLKVASRRAACTRALALGLIAL
jgi:DNA-binding CsgD family transcriptional regulator